MCGTGRSSEQACKVRQGDVWLIRRARTQAFLTLIWNKLAIRVNLAWTPAVQSPPSRLYTVHILYKKHRGIIKYGLQRRGCWLGKCITFSKVQQRTVFYTTIKTTVCTTKLFWNGPFKKHPESEGSKNWVKDQIRRFLCLTGNILFIFDVIKQVNGNRMMTSLVLELVPHKPHLHCTVLPANTEIAWENEVRLAARHYFSLLLRLHYMND